MKPRSPTPPPLTTSGPLAHLALFGLCGLGLTACWSPNEPAGANDDALTVFPVELGKGIPLNAPPGGVSGRGPCVDFVPQLATRANLDTYSVAISTTSSRDLTDKINVALAGEFPIEGVKTKLDTAFEGRWDEKSSTEHVALIARIESVRQDAQLSGVNEGNLCRTARGGQIDSVDRFLSECGEVWHDSRTLGGFFVITWDTSKLSEEELRKFKAELGVGDSTAKGMGKFMTRLSRASTVASSLSELHVDALGYPTPAKIDVATFQNEVNRITTEISAAHARGALHDPSYGTVIDQHFRPYAAADLAVCVNIPKLPGDADRILQCTSEARQYGQTFNDANGPLPPQEALVRSWIEKTQRGEAHWPSIEHVNQAASEAWLQEVADCRTKVGDTVKACGELRTQWTNALANATTPPDEKTICDGACAFPTECDPDALATRARSLPAPISLPPPAFPRPIHQAFSVRQGDAPLSLGPVSDRVCVLSGVFGGLYGGGEFARVEIQGGEYWLVYTTQRTATIERGYAHAICVSAAHFTNGVGDQLLSPEIGECRVDLFGATPAVASVTCPVKATGGFLALSGVTGRFDDDSHGPNAPLPIDFVRVERSPSTTRDGEVMASQDGASMVGLTWTTAGVELPPGKVTPSFALAGGPRTVRSLSRPYNRGSLGVRTSEGLCYLTRIGGMLHDSSDGVMIEEDAGEWSIYITSACWSGLGGIFPSLCDRRQIEASVQCVKFDQR